LTGRKQLHRSSVEVWLRESERDSAYEYVVMSLANLDPFKSMPETARVKLTLSENKFSEILEFGTLGAMRSRPAQANIRTPEAFAAPSCQLRIVGADEDNKGRILGSTHSWNLFAGKGSAGKARSEGMLFFQPSKIAPRVWKLDIREEDHPIVYIDESISDGRSWAESDSVFAGCVLPAVLRELFHDILREGDRPDQEWQKDWLEWANALMGGAAPPWKEEDEEQKHQWIDDLIGNFCAKHGLLGALLRQREQESAS